MAKKTKNPELTEIATTLDGRDITRPWVDRLAVNPPDDSVLIERGGGDYALYREVLRDDHVMAALQQRRRAVIARPWEVRPGGKRAIDKAAADFLRETVERIGWDTICDKMLMGVFYGFAVGECLWAPDGRYWTLAEVKVRDRRRFGFDGENRLRLKTIARPLGELLPERKFWVFAAGADHDDAPYGLGLAHWLYWPVWFKRNGHRFWATFLERFGTPAVMGKYPVGTSQADQNKLLQALAALRRDAAVTVPDGILIELLEATRGGTADHAGFVAAMNQAILVAAIGQTASTQGTPGKLGNDDTQNDVRLDIVRADADLLSASFNASVARWLTEWNFPNAAIPQVWRIIEEPEDLETRARRDKTIFEMGYKPTARYIEETYGGEWEAISEPAENPMANPAETSGSPVPAEFAAPAVPTFADQDALDALPDPDAAVLDSVLAPIVEALAAGQTPEALVGQIADWYPLMDDTALTDLLARAMFVAELHGRYSAQQERGNA